MARPIAKLLALFAVLSAVALLAAVIFTLSQPAPAPPPLPNPNGYDDFVSAGKTLTGNTSDYGTMKEEQLRAMVATNAEALRLARTGLSRECRVPLDYSTNFGAHLEDLAPVKRMAGAFAAEGRVAELENRPDEAAHSYLDAIRLGHESVRGGVMIDALVGVAIRAIGCSALEKVTARLDAKQCREAAAVLQAFEGRSETAQAALQQERRWAWRTFGLKGQFVRLLTWKSLRQNEQKTASRIKSQQCQEQTLVINLACRAYELENGTPPKSLDDLVPGYLKNVPKDPLTGTNRVF